MLGSELRKKYIEFFESKGHLHQPSDSLVPNDPSLLFTSAGMVQFKPYFLGAETPPRTRVVTAQKCLRTDDIEEVGDAVHHTFFEMMGNFSFGDYFKRDAVHFAWEFLTEWLKLPADRLWTSVYLDDDEAANIWLNEIGLPAERLVRLGEDKNYWPANAPSKGPNGPCGPCNEIFLDLYPERGYPEDPAKAIAYDSNRFVEIWNLVYMQFMRHEGGVLEPLPTKNIDTGLGLERVTAILQNKPSNYETDLFMPIISTVENLASVKYGSGEDIDIALRTIADHIRGAVFCIADGVMPSNVKRGYVLRRMIRRAIVKARLALKLEDAFLARLAETVAEMFTDSYPEIGDRINFITNVLQSEEEKFQKTLATGLARLDDEIKSLKAAGKSVVSGQAAFTLYDTFGFPLELTEELAGSEGLELDKASFEALMEDQRKRAQEGNKMFADVFSAGEGTAFSDLQKKVGKTLFEGYQSLAADSRIVAILRGGEAVESAEEGDEVQIILDKTPFYAESGGQVGDQGSLKGEQGSAEITQTRKTADIWLHEARIVTGELKTGDLVSADVDSARRRAIMRNHTATHLLHAALRKHLGTHVAQAGSLVEPDRLRFDFSHFQAVTADELRAIEEEVNMQALQDYPVAAETTSLKDAREKGAMALFGEKYGDVVRTITIGEVSLELCGGTHLTHTAEIGLFKIVSEGSVAAGVRRIEALTGAGAYGYVKNLEDQLSEVARKVQSPSSDLTAAIERLQNTLKEQQKTLDQLKSKSSAEEADTLVAGAVDVNGIRVISARASSGDADSLSRLADQLTDKLQSGVVLLGAEAGGKVLFISKVTEDVVKKGVSAGNLVKLVAQETGGGGGGRPEFAKAGGKDPAKLDSALSLALESIKKAVG